VVSLAASVWGWVTSLKAAQIQLNATSAATTGSGGLFKRAIDSFKDFKAGRQLGMGPIESLKQAIPALGKFGTAMTAARSGSSLLTLAGLGPVVVAALAGAGVGVMVASIARKLTPDWGWEKALERGFAKIMSPATTARQSVTVAHETFQNRLWKDLDPKKGNVASIAADINRAVEMEAGRGASGFQLNRMRQEAAETLMTEANRRKTRMALGGKEDVNEIKRLQELAAAQLKAVEESSRIAAEQGQAQRQADRAKEEREAAEARMRMVPVGGGAYGFSYTQQYSPR
jgi:hypothetical protein